jgi:hypothetical protein
MMAVVALPQKTAAFCTGMVLLIAGTGIVAQAGETIVNMPIFLLSITFLFGGMLLGFFNSPPAITFLHIAIIGIVMRIVFIAAFPVSDDVYRYLWEGKIQWAGFNPFIVAPDDLALGALRDSFWQLINHPHVPTCYWPFAQLLFAGIWKICPTVIGVKIAMTLFDCATMVILVLILKKKKGLPRNLFLYAGNPLALIFIAGQGHVESVVGFFIVLSLFFLVSKKPWAMFLALGFAVMVKPTAVCILPFLLTRQSIKKVWYVLIPVILFVFYGNAIASAGIVPLRFAQDFHYNGLVYTVVNSFLHGSSAGIIYGTLFVVAGGYAFFVVQDSFRAAAYAVALFLLFSPTVHPWYFLMILPFCVLYKMPQWLVLAFTTLPLTFFFVPSVSQIFSKKLELLLMIEYIPFVIVSFWVLVSGRKHGCREYPPPCSATIIIPAMNEEQAILRAIGSINEQDFLCQIIVADGGSSDKTCDIAAAQKNVTVIAAPRGRGNQIHTALRHATGDMVMILHADSLLLPKAVSSALKSLAQNSDAVGGSFAARYDNCHVKFRLIELLNTMRSRISGISFGDQVQFFRRTVVGEDFPCLMLMEDVELSFLLLERGGIVCLGTGTKSSTRRWEKIGYAGTASKVIFLTGLYIVKRRLGILQNKTDAFFKAYYGTSV